MGALGGWVFVASADGNLHATPVKDPGQSDADWEAMLPDLLADIYRATAKLGGTISGEHGIGFEKLHEMSFIFSQDDIIALGLKIGTDQVAQVFLIINDQNSRHV